jgi:hypothetical protein
MVNDSIVFVQPLFVNCFKNENLKSEAVLHEYNRWSLREGGEAVQMYPDFRLYKNNDN